MSFFGLNFGGNADVDIILDGQDERRMAEIKDENGRKERLYLFYDGESVTGKVNVTLHRKTNRLEHQGIKIEFLGQIELYYDRGNHHEFLSLVKQLAGPGELVQNTSFEFEFNQVEKPYECYTGANVRLRYFLRVTIVRRLTDMTKEMDLLVHTLATYPEMNNPIKMEVGIEECLHIEFEYNKSKYHLKDVIVGKIYFLLVRIKIKHMEVAIIKRETTGSGPNTFHDNETIAKYEIMDGAPVKGESIPIRVFLAGYDLTPTMRDINKKFSVKYYLNLVLVDEEERRYFKQQEITLWRKGERVRKAPLMGNQPYQIPHAMARHVAGDVPTANVRTAPTPSEPNTPVLAVGVAAAPTPAPAPPGSFPQMQQQQEQEQSQPRPATLHSALSPEAAPAPEPAVAPQQPVNPEPESEPNSEPEPTGKPSGPAQPVQDLAAEPAAEEVAPVVEAQVPADIESAPTPPMESPEEEEEEEEEEKERKEEEGKVPVENATSRLRQEEEASAAAAAAKKPPRGEKEEGESKVEPAEVDPEVDDSSPRGEGPPPMDDLALDDDDEEEEDANAVMDLSDQELSSSSPPPPQPTTMTSRGDKAEKRKEAVPS